MATISCPSCGKRIIDNGKNCPHCNAEIVKKRDTVKEKTYRGKYICEDCGTIGNGKSVSSGYFIGEIIVWVLGIVLIPFTAFISIFVPILYSIYRFSSYKTRCSECGGKLIGVDTPRGKKILKELGFTSA